MDDEHVLILPESDRASARAVGDDRVVPVDGDISACPAGTVAGLRRRTQREAFAAQGADPALGDRVRSRCSDWGADVGAGEHGVEGGELAVPVADQEPNPAGVVVEVQEEVAGLLG
jgi:hypothetical protein